MKLHCTEPFISTLPSSQYNLNYVERDVKKTPKTTNHHSDLQRRQFVGMPNPIFLEKQENYLFVGLNIFYSDYLLTCNKYYTQKHSLMDRNDSKMLI